MRVMDREGNHTGSPLRSALVYPALLCLLPVLVFALAAGARRAGVAMILPEPVPAALDPMLQIREREEEPALARVYLQKIRRVFPDRRLLLILGASEAGHHGCNAEHCLTRDLAELLPAWTPINLTRRGQSLRETARFLENIAGELDAQRTAIVVTVNPVFFAAPGGLFPQAGRTQEHSEAAGGALLPDREWAALDGADGANEVFGARLEEWFAARFGFGFFRRALFRHRLGVAPAGDWSSNWLGPFGPALLPQPQAEGLRRIKIRRIDWSYYLSPGFGPTPQRSWREYYEQGRIDLAFAGRRMRGLDLKRGRAELLAMQTELGGRGLRGFFVRTPLNPGMLRLLDADSGGREFTATYDRFRGQWAAFVREDGTAGDPDAAAPAERAAFYSLDELAPADFVDLDHLAPSGQARLARLIAGKLKKG